MQHQTSNLSISSSDSATLGQQRHEEQQKQQQQHQPQFHFMVSTTSWNQKQKAFADEKSRSLRRHDQQPSAPSTYRSSRATISQRPMLATEQRSRIYQQRKGTDTSLEYHSSSNHQNQLNETSAVREDKPIRHPGLDTTKHIQGRGSNGGNGQPQRTRLTSSTSGIKPLTTPSDIVFRTAQRADSRSRSLSRRETTASSSVNDSSFSTGVTIGGPPPSKQHRRSHSATSRRNVPTNNENDGFRSTAATTTSNAAGLPPHSRGRQLSSNSRPTSQHKSVTRHSTPTGMLPHHHHQQQPLLPDNKTLQCISPQRQLHQVTNITTTEAPNDYYPPVWDLVFETAERQILRQRGVQQKSDNGDKTIIVSLDDLNDVALANHNRRDTILTLSHSSGRSSVDDFNLTPFLGKVVDEDQQGANALAETDAIKNTSSAPDEMGVDIGDGEEELTTPRKKVVMKSLVTSYVDAKETQENICNKKSGSGARRVTESDTNAGEAQCRGRLKQDKTRQQRRGSNVNRTRKSPSSGRDSTLRTGVERAVEREASRGPVKRLTSTTTAGEVPLESPVVRSCRTSLSRSLERGRQTLPVEGRGSSIRSTSAQGNRFPRPSIRPLPLTVPQEFHFATEKRNSIRASAQHRQQQQPYSPYKERKTSPTTDGLSAKPPISPTFGRAITRVTALKAVSPLTRNEQTSKDFQSMAKEQQQRGPRTMHQKGGHRSLLSPDRRCFNVEGKQQSYNQPAAVQATMTETRSAEEIQNLENLKDAYAGVVRENISNRETCKRSSVRICEPLECKETNVGDHGEDDRCVHDDDRHRSLKRSDTTKSLRRSDTTKSLCVPMSSYPMSPMRRSQQKLKEKVFDCGNGHNNITTGGLSFSISTSNQIESSQGNDPFNIGVHEEEAVGDVGHKRYADDGHGSSEVMKVKDAEETLLPSRAERVELMEQEPCYNSDVTMRETEVALSECSMVSGISSSLRESNEVSDIQQPSLQHHPSKFEHYGTVPLNMSQGTSEECIDGDVSEAIDAVKIMERNDGHDVMDVEDDVVVEQSEDGRTESLQSYEVAGVESSRTEDEIIRGMAATGDNVFLEGSMEGDRSVSHTGFNEVSCKAIMGNEERSYPSHDGSSVRMGNVSIPSVVVVPVNGMEGRCDSSSSLSISMVANESIDRLHSAELEGHGSPMRRSLIRDETRDTLSCETIETVENDCDDSMVVMSDQSRSGPFNGHSVDVKKDQTEEDRENGEELSSPRCQSPIPVLGLLEESPQPSSSSIHSPTDITLDQGARARMETLCNSPSLIETHETERVLKAPLEQVKSIHNYNGRLANDCFEGVVERSRDCVAPCYCSDENEDNTKLRRSKSDSENDSPLLIHCAGHQSANQCDDDTDGMTRKCVDRNACPAISKGSGFMPSRIAPPRAMKRCPQSKIESHRLISSLVSPEKARDSLTSSTSEKPHLE